MQKRQFESSNCLFCSRLSDPSTPPVYPPPTHPLAPIPATLAGTLTALHFKVAPSGHRQASLTHPVSPPAMGVPWRRRIAIVDGSGAAARFAHASCFTTHLGRPTGVVASCALTYRVGGRPRCDLTSIGVPRAAPNPIHRRRWKRPGASRPIERNTELQRARARGAKKRTKPYPCDAALSSGGVSDVGAARITPGRTGRSGRIPSSGNACDAISANAGPAA